MREPVTGSCSIVADTLTVPRVGLSGLRGGRKRAANVASISRAFNVARRCSGERRRSATESAIGAPSATALSVATPGGAPATVEASVA